MTCIQGVTVEVLDESYKSQLIST